MKTTQEVVEFFSGRKGFPLKDKDAQFACSYLDEKVLNSMEIVEMVMHFEDRFGIRFSPKDMQSVEFRTVGGLIGVIDKLIGEK